jgi:sterol desaturase/sphingolipid hydroxylase (fatty acid hydroxylase superfamily)
MLSKFTSSIQFQAPELALPEFTAEDWRTFAILTVFPVLLVIEASFARQERRAKDYRQSYLANFGTWFLNDTLLSLLSVSSLWLVAEHYAGWGLLNAVPDPLLKAGLSFVLLDLALYFWHRANHSDWLWIFHKVHHSDRVMNVSTAFRLHFVEVFTTVLVKALFIAVMGVETAVMVANEAIITLFVMFHHTNLSFRSERWLGWLIIVPYLHRVHHSAKREEHDHNYGAVFSCWDRMFGTLAELKPAEIGLRHVLGQNLLELVKFALTRQIGPHPKSLHAMIAEAAYYRAEKRGFAPGYESVDWMEAEREIRKTQIPVMNSSLGRG